MWAKYTLNNFCESFQNIFYVYEWLTLMWMYTTGIYGTQRDQMRASHALDLELQMVVSCHVCAGNCTRVLFGSSQCSQLLSCLSGPTLTVYSFRTTVLLHCACCPLTPRSSLLLPLLGSFSSCRAPQPSLLTHSSSHFAHTHPVRFSFFSHLKSSHSSKAQAATEGGIACCHCVSPTPTCLGTRALLQQRR